MVVPTIMDFRERGTTGQQEQEYSFILELKLIPPNASSPPTSLGKVRMKLIFIKDTETKQLR